MAQKIALHDADQTRFPNLALMKLSAYHKARGHEVEWWNPMVSYDEVFSSKVFTFTDEDAYLPGSARRGGTGYGSPEVLLDEVEHIMPDYSLYPDLGHSVGFLTRGCSRKCTWCVVPEKEGGIRAHADIDEFLAHKEVVMMDNNVLAHPHGLQQIEKLGGMRVKVDFNQGLDYRMIDDAVARLLGRLKWRDFIRLACDDSSHIDGFRRAVERLRWHNVNPARIFVYMLVKDVEEAVERVRFLKGLYLHPFAQPYRGPDGVVASQEARDFARFVNHKATFKKTTWEEYKARKNA